MEFLKWRGLMGFIFLVMIFIAGRALAADTVNIVVLDPISGTMKDVGDRTVWGVQFAVDETNAAGGLLGKQIKLIPEDTQMKPDVAARKAIRAIMEDKAKFILHNTSSAVAQALMDVAEKNKVIYLDLGAEADYLTGKNFTRYMFRTCFTTGNRARAYAEFFKTKPWRRFYLMNQDYAFGHAVADDFKKMITKEIPDAKIVGEDFAPIGQKDFAPYISKILSSGAEIIFTGNYGADLANLIIQGAQMGIKLPVRYATYFFDDDVQLPQTGQAAVGSFVNSTYLPTINTPQNKAFVERWHKKFKDTNHPYPASNLGYTYNGAMFLFAAIKKAKSSDAEAVIKAFEGMEYAGLVGKQIMRACDHQIVMPGPIGEIEAKSRIFPFPFPDNPVMIPLDKVAVPPSETGNPRCIGSK
ncbi:MAG TPA: ABC transporter substrate-binding protein [Thermodesulfobacteriota bacterium]|nr:ABC transporter substrate-binding protein [Thermodesulfobacteriota bacterium]